MISRAIIPAPEFKGAFLAMLDDFDSNQPHNTEFYAPARHDFESYVQSLLGEEQGLNLPEGWVACTSRWLLDESNAIIGVTRVRHSIATPFLSENAGHIGFDVRPSFRRRGFGHLAMRVALQRARHLCIPRVLLYTAEDNLASRAVIERAGGTLERIAYSEFGMKCFASIGSSPPLWPNPLFEPTRAGTAPLGTSS